MEIVEEINNSVKIPDMNEMEYEEDPIVKINTKLDLLESKFTLIDKDIQMFNLGFKHLEEILKKVVHNQKVIHTLINEKNNENNNN